MSTPKGAKELGKTMYLFTSKTNSSDVIISAHGGYMNDNSGFTVEGVNIFFYVAHKSVMVDPGVGELSKNLSKAKVVEHFKPGDLCRDYYLSKYQGKHAGESGKEELETYSSIAQSIDRRDWQRNDKFNRALSGQGEFQAVVDDWGTNVLTIRNRSAFIAGPLTSILGVKLSEAVRALRKGMPTVRNIHCSFCRSDMRRNDAPSQRVQYG